MITTISRQIVKHCPFKPETDHGQLTITIDGPAPELHALAAAVDALTTEPISHEDFTAQVAAMLPPGSRAASTWSTAGWAVEVSDVVPR